LKNSLPSFRRFGFLTLLFCHAFLFAQTPLLRVHEIQGSGFSSPFAGQFISVDTTVVTFANASFAYVQDANGDGNPLTSEGLLIIGGNTLQLVPGDRVLISGVVQEPGDQTAISSSVTINKLFGGSTLAATPFNPGTELINNVSPLEAFEGMLLDFAVTVGAGTDGFGAADVYTTPNRPFREPGRLDAAPAGIPVFDGNPELMNYDPNGLGQSNFNFHNAGDQITGIGILEEFSFGYELAPVASTQLELVEPTRAVRARNPEEITVASINTLFLLEDEDDYNLRLTKMVNYIANSLNYPEVIALQEIGGANEVEDLVFRLRQQNSQLGDYLGFSPASNGFLNLGYLVHRRIENPVFTELGGGEFFSEGGILHNRFPLLAEFQVPQSNGVSLRVLNLHIRSLNGVDDDISVRRRRHEQAISIANMVEDLRDDNLVVVGDYNAFQFTDGFVDVYNQIRGRPSLGAQFPVENIVNPPLLAAGDLLPDAERYSFVFRGSAQQLDHCLYNELSGLTVDEFAFARGNADAAITYENNAFQLPRASDHDGFVLFLDVDALVSSTSTVPQEKGKLHFSNPARPNGTVAYENLPLGSRILLTDQSGALVAKYGLQSSTSIFMEAGMSGSLNLPDRLASGSYYLSTHLPRGRVINSQKIIIIR
jgi:hypothetical protein